MAANVGIPDQVQRLRKSIADFVANFLKYRKPDLMVGKFLDSEGCQVGQFGIGGVSFLLAIKQKHGIDGKALHFAEKVVAEHFQPGGDPALSEFAPLFKDVPRIPTKSVPLSLSLKRKSDFNSLFRDILNNGVSDDLVKPAIDVDALEGDVFATCYLLQFLHFSKQGLPKVYENRITALLQAVSEKSATETHDIYQRLYISTTLMMFQFEGASKRHFENLQELFARDQDWTRCFDDQASFLDVWYSDRSSGIERHRFLRIPTFYVILSAIYLQFGASKDFFCFAPVRTIFERMPKEYASFAKEDRARAAIYYVFFMFVVLFPDEYFGIERAPFLRRVRTRLNYFWGNLTMVGLAVLLLLVLGLFSAIHFGFVSVLHVLGFQGFESAFSNLLGALGVSVSAALGLLKTRKR